VGLDLYWERWTVAANPLKLINSKNTRGISVLTTLYGLIAFATVVLGYYQLTFSGFPDGYRSEYVRASDYYFEIFNHLNCLFALYFLVRGLTPRFLPSFLNIKLSIAIGLHVVLLILEVYGIEYYFKDFLGLDDGIGG
jgi:hypothetical protein